MERVIAAGPPPGEPHRSANSPLRSWLAGSVAAPSGQPGSTRARMMLAAAGLKILGAVLFGFLAQVTIVGSLEHNRDQQVAYDDLRLTLAEGTAPVGPVGGKAVDLGVPVARITIPSIGIKEVVREGTTSGVLRGGPGHRRDTVYPGQPGTSVLMGRRMAFGGPFSGLRLLEKDAEIKVVTGQGELIFRVLGVRHAGDPQAPALAPNASRLTLITTAGSRFAPSGIDRVDADLVGITQPAATPKYTATTLPRTERVLAREPGALGAASGWGFLLVCAAVVATMLRTIWGRWQTWVVAVPVLGFLGMEVADNIARLLPNIS